MAIHLYCALYSIDQRNGTVSTHPPHILPTFISLLSFSSSFPHKPSISSLCFFNVKTLEEIIVAPLPVIAVVLKSSSEYWALYLSTMNKITSGSHDCASLFSIRAHPGHG